MKQKLLLQKLLFFLLMLVSASVLNAQSVVSEGWDESSAKEEWSDKKVKWSIEWVTNYSDGSTQRKKFTMSDTRTMTAPDDQCIGNGLSHKTDDWVEILDPEITFVSQETQSQEKNGATFSWVRESRTITDIVKADDTWMRTEMVKERYQKGLSATFTWNACDPFDCKVSFKGKVFAFGRKQVSVRYEGEAISKEEKGMKYHLSYDIGDYVTKLPAFITYDDYDSTFFPPEWGWLYDAKQTVSNNRSSNSYVYIWSLHFANGVVLPVVIPAGDTSANWHFEYAEYCDESSEKSYNSAVYNKSKGAWINAVASDAYISIDEESGASTYIPVDDPSQASVMCWMRDGQLLETKTCFDASNCNWDEGHGTSVHTDRYDLDVTNGRLTATDTYRSVYMGSWKARGAGNEDTGIMGTWLSANPTSSNFGDSYKSTKIRIIYNGGGTISVNGKQVQGSSTQVNIDGSADIVIVPNDGYELESVYREIYLLSDDINVYINDNELLLGRLLSKGSGSVLNNFTFTFKEADPEEQEDLQDGDRFTATNADGVEMTFQVISAADKTCEVARQGKDRNTIVTSPVPESITIPAEANGFKVVSIGYQAFYGAKGIKSVIIPEGVTSINTQAFRECYNLASITFPTSLEECGTDSFEDCAFGATVHISDLESWCNVSLPSWDLYGWHLFLNGEEVNDLVIPNGVTSIGESMALVSPLTNCASLTSVTIPASVTKMYAPFSGCSNLTSVTTFAEEPVAIFTGFPNATNSITNATLYVPKGSKAAYEAADYWKDFKEILEIEDETPEDIITFADPKVKAICVTNWDTNGDGKLSKTEATAVTSLGDVFMGNSEITSFDELQYFTGLTTIPDNAFSGCGSLKSIRLPKSLTSIGEYAFEDCTSLETVVSFIETPFELGEGAFCAWESYDGGNDWLKYNLHFSLYVPVGTKGLYRAAGWDVDESYGDYRTILSGTPENPGSFTVDGIVYDPIDATTVELIDGKNASGDVTIPSMVANGNANYQVTEIGACAFKGNTSLTSIVIPNCVKAIRPFAFNGCTGLTTVTSYIETPFSLSALKGVFLNNENVVYATYLQFTLYVPAGTKSLYEQASWTDASRIVEIEDETPEPLPVGSTFTEDNGVIYKVTEGNNVTVINGKNAIGDVVIPDKVVNNGVEYTVTAIAEGAFYKGGETQNAELTSITIPSSVERIEPMTFQYCSSLTSIVIPEGVTSIGSQAFLGCTSLSSVSIPSTVTTVEVNAFSNCTALNDVYITDIAAYCAIPFKYSTSSPLYYAKHLYLNGEEVKELVIPQGVTAIDNYAFYNCRSLNSVTLPSSLTSIGDYVFAGCENITQLISYIKTPENISSAYYYMTERNADLIIPVGSKSKYETATGWKNFQNVVEISAFDINHDYYINKIDVNNLVNDIMGKRSANYDKTQDDITGDQKVDMLDIVKMVRIIKNRYPNTEAYLGYDPEAAGGDIDIDDPPCVDCGED